MLTIGSSTLHSQTERKLRMMIGQLDYQLVQKETNAVASSVHEEFSAVKASESFARHLKVCSSGPLTPDLKEAP